MPRSNLICRCLCKKCLNRRSAPAKFSVQSALTNTFSFERRAWAQRFSGCVEGMACTLVFYHVCSCEPVLTANMPRGNVWACGVLTEAGTLGRS